MMKKIKTTLLVLVALSVQAQKTISFTPQWKEGQRFRLTSQVGIKIYENGSESSLNELLGGSKTKLSTSSSFLISKVLPDGYEIEIGTDDFALNFPMMQGLDSILKANPVGAVRLVTDKQFHIKDMSNWQDFAASVKNVGYQTIEVFLRNIAKNIRKDSLKKFEEKAAEARLKVRSKMDSALSTKQQVMDMAIDGYAYYFEAYQQLFGMGKDYTQTGLFRSYRDQMKLMPQEPLLGTMYNKLEKRDGATSKCYSKIVYDPTALSDIMRKRGKQVTQKITCSETKSYVFNTATQTLKSMVYEIVIEMDQIKLVTKVNVTIQ